MKVIKATLTGKIKDDYAFPGIKFSFCSAPILRRVKQFREWRTCREDMMDTLRAAMVRAHTKIDRRKTRLLVYMRTGPGGTVKDKEKFYTAERKRAYEQIQASLKVIQHFEQRLGWPLTRIYKVEYNESPLVCMYMVVGSSRWQKSTHYFSLYLLMLRLGRSGFHSKFNNHKELGEELGKFANKRGNDNDDAAFVKDTYHKWELFLQNQNKLFAGRSSKHIFKKSSLVDGNTGYNEGINQLCTGWSRDLSLASKFRKLCEENDVKQKEMILERRKTAERKSL